MEKKAKKIIKIKAKKEENPTFELIIDNSELPAKLYRINKITSEKLLLQQGDFDRLKRNKNMMDWAGIYTRFCVTCGKDFCPRQIKDFNCSRKCSLANSAKVQSAKIEAKKAKLANQTVVSDQEEVKSRPLNWFEKEKEFIGKLSCWNCLEVFTENYPDYRQKAGYCDKCLHKGYLQAGLPKLSPLECQQITQKVR